MNVEHAMPGELVDRNTLRWLADRLLVLESTAAALRAEVLRVLDPKHVASCARTPQPDDVPPREREKAPRKARRAKR